VYHGNMSQRFEIVSEDRREYRRFNTIGTQLTVRLNPPTEPGTDPVNHFLSGMNDLFEHVLQGVADSDMVGVAICNDVNQNDRAVVIRFRRKDQLSADVIWSVFEKVAQSNARFNALDSITIVVHSVGMPVGFGRVAVKTNGRPLSVMAHIKKSIIEVKAESNCLAHAPIIAVAKATNDPNYKAYIQGRKIHLAVQNLLTTTGIDLSEGAGIPEIERFQDHFSQYKIVVYEGLNCDSIMYEGHVDTPARINLLYDDITRHYHVIGNLTGAMAKRFVCKGCGKGCRRESTHICDQTCSDCMASPPCVFSGVRIPCTDCNRHFRSMTCFKNHKDRRGKKKPVCESRQICRSCDGPVTRERGHECGKRYCATCKQSMEIGHLCYMQPLKNEVPSGDRVLYVYYDIETTENTPYVNSCKSTVHVPNLVCLQQSCSQCESSDDVKLDCARCGKRQHAFWLDPVGDMLSYLCEPRPWVKQIVAIAHNAKAFDLQFILDTAVFLKC
jgi:hypothetical protein